MREQIARVESAGIESAGIENTGAITHQKRYHKIPIVKLK